MILVSLVLLVLGLLVAFVVAGVSVVGAAFMFIFGDVVVLVLLLAMLIVKLVNKHKNK